MKIIYQAQNEYPEKLNNIYSSPARLYLVGDESILNKPSVAIIGCRDASDYGKKVAFNFAYELAKEGFVVISGLARGIDTYAHLGAVKAGGKTIAVLGSGLKHIYPSENKKLCNEIVKNSGAIITEYEPHTKPLPMNFPSRNRIISGLSNGVLVVEAKQKSGTLITVDYALDQGKDVFVIPGNITSINSYGTNELIKQGAKLVENVDDILTEFSEFTGFSRKFPKHSAKSLAKAEKRVYDMLSLKPKYIDEILSTSQDSYEEVIQALFQLEAKGYIKQIHQNLYIKKM